MNIEPLILIRKILLAGDKGVSPTQFCSLFEVEDLPSAVADLSCKLDDLICFYKKDDPSELFPISHLTTADSVNIVLRPQLRLQILFGSLLSGITTCGKHQSPTPSGIKWTTHPISFFSLIVENGTTGIHTCDISKALFIDPRSSYFFSRRLEAVRLISSDTTMTKCTNTGSTSRILRATRFYQRKAILPLLVSSINIDEILEIISRLSVQAGGAVCITDIRSAAWEYHCRDFINTEPDYQVNLGSFFSEIEPTEAFYEALDSVLDQLKRKGSIRPLLASVHGETKQVLCYQSDPVSLEKIQTAEKDEDESMIKIRHFLAQNVSKIIGLPIKVIVLEVLRLLGPRGIIISELCNLLHIRPKTCFVLLDSFTSNTGFNKRKNTTLFSPISSEVEHHGRSRRVRYFYTGPQVPLSIKFIEPSVSSTKTFQSNFLSTQCRPICPTSSSVTRLRREQLILDWLQEEKVLPINRDLAVRVQNQETSSEYKIDAKSIRRIAHSLESRGLARIGYYRRIGVSPSYGDSGQILMLVDSNVSPQLEARLSRSKLLTLFNKEKKLLSPTRPKKPLRIGKIFNMDYIAHQHCDSSITKLAAYPPISNYLRRVAIFHAALLRVSSNLESNSGFQRLIVPLPYSPFFYQLLSKFTVWEWINFYSVYISESSLKTLDEFTLEPLDSLKLDIWKAIPPYITKKRWYAFLTSLAELGLLYFPSSPDSLPLDIDAEEQLVVTGSGLIGVSHTTTIEMDNMSKKEYETFWTDIEIELLQGLMPISESDQNNNQLDTNSAAATTVWLKSHAASFYRPIFGKEGKYTLSNLITSRFPVVLESIKEELVNLESFLLASSRLFLPLLPLLSFLTEKKNIAPVLCNPECSQSSKSCNALTIFLLWLLFPFPIAANLYARCADKTDVSTDHVDTDSIGIRVIKEASHLIFEHFIPFFNSKSLISNTKLRNLIETTFDNNTRSISKAIQSLCNALIIDIFAVNSIGSMQDSLIEEEQRNLDIIKLDDYPTSMNQILSSVNSSVKRRQLVYTTSTNENSFAYCDIQSFIERFIATERRFAQSSTYSALVSQTVLKIVLFGFISSDKIPSPNANSFFVTENSPANLEMSVSAIFGAEHGGKPSPLLLQCVNELKHLGVFTKKFYLGRNEHRTHRLIGGLPLSFTEKFSSFFNLEGIKLGEIKENYRPLDEETFPSLDYRDNPVATSFEQLIDNMIAEYHPIQSRPISLSNHMELSVSSEHVELNPLINTEPSPARKNSFLYSEGIADCSPISSSSSSSMVEKVVEMLGKRGRFGASLIEIADIAEVHYENWSQASFLYKELKKSTLIIAIHWAHFVHANYAFHWLLPIFKHDTTVPIACIEPRVWACNGLIFQAALGRVYSYIKEHPGLTLPWLSCAEIGDLMIELIDHRRLVGQQIYNSEEGLKGSRPIWKNDLPFAIAGFWKNVTAVYRVEMCL